MGSAHPEIGNALTVRKKRNQKHMQMHIQFYRNITHHVFGHGEAITIQLAKPN
jgi:hypothetical protein